MLYHPAPQQFYGPHQGQPQIQMSMSSPYRFMSGMQPKAISLPSMQKVSETIGALGMLARRFLRNSSPSAIPDAESKSEGLLQQQPTAAASNVASAVVEFKVKPEDDPELNAALYTLSRNVLGKVRAKGLQKM
jgi:hypothetical protein